MNNKNEEAGDGNEREQFQGEENPPPPRLSPSGKNRGNAEGQEPKIADSDDRPRHQPPGNVPRWGEEEGHTEGDDRVEDGETLNGFERNIHFLLSRRTRL